MSVHECVLIKVYYKLFAISFNISIRIVYNLIKNFHTSLPVHPWLICKYDSFSDTRMYNIINEQCHTFYVPMNLK